MFPYFIDGKLVFFPRTIDKNMPVVVVSSFNSNTYKDSVYYRGNVLWNNLTKDWQLDKLPYIKFKEKVIEWIITKRKNQFVYN